jgi:hypothetical protein
VASPVVLIVATLAAEELHVAVLVRFCVLASVYVPVAVNCCVLPLAIDGFAGVTAIDTNVGAVTVRLSPGEVTPLKLAVMVTGPPAFTPVARPAALIVAMVLSDDAHVAVLVRFCVLPSV